MLIRYENHPANEVSQALPRSDSVRRESLCARLDAVLNYPVVLVSAPAGYGKTTLIAHWLMAQSGRQQITSASTICCVMPGVSGTARS